MRVDVIVTTFDRARLLRGALESLERQALDPDTVVRALVVDNASTDDTRAVVADAAAAGPMALAYHLEDVQGVTHARNRGIRESTAGWVAFLDDDEIAAPTWLRELLRAADASGAGCVAGGVVPVMEDGGAVPLPPFCRQLLGETPPADRCAPFTGKSLPGTGNCLIRREVFDAVGGFDTALVRGAEDTDFFRRVRGAGYALWYAPRAVVLHRVPRYRTTSEYLLWTARRHGTNYADLDVKEGGRGRVVRNALLRAGQLLAVTAPALAAARVRRRPTALDWRCRVARATAYGREALRLAVPRLTQSAFFRSLHFRAEGERFRREDPVAP